MIFPSDYPPYPAPAIGLMCGTFDPLHLGHITVAHHARWQLDLSHVHFLPVGQPTHKTTMTPAHHRVNMLKLALADYESFQLDTTDVDRPPPHYTATLLPLLQAKFPRTNLWLLLGGDSLRDLPTWHNPQAIINSGCRLAVYNRPGVTIDWHTLETKLPGLREIVTMLKGDKVQLSSTSMRERLAAGQPLSSAVPSAVQQYITEHNLYDGRS